MENTSNVGFLRYFCYLMRFLLSHYKIIFLGLSFSENRSRNVHETYQRMLRYFFLIQEPEIPHYQTIN